MTEGSTLNLTNRRRRSFSTKKRSKSHSRASTSSEVDNHLEKLESKLDQAKQARDNYLSYLKKKYPEWRQSSSNLVKFPPPYNSQIHSPVFIPNYSNPSQFFNYDAPIFRIPQNSILNDLQTSKHFWNSGMSEIAPFESYQTPQQILPVFDPIPSCSIYLQSDLPGVMGKLHEIRDNLRELREKRLTMPTIEYYRKYAPNLKEQIKTNSFTNFKTEKQQNSISKWRRPGRTEIPSLAELKAKIMNMDLNVERKTREILDGAYRKYSQFEEKKEIEKDLTNLMPEWLKNDESIVKKMEKEEKEILEKMTGQKLDKNESSVVEKKKPVPEILQHSSEEKSSEIVIAPTRTLILNPNPVLSVPKASESVVPPAVAIVSENTKPQQLEYSPPPQKVDSSAYSKMLELLKPTKYTVSSSSSSEDELAVPKMKSPSKPVQVSKPLVAEPIPASSHQPVPASEKPKFDFGKSLFTAGNLSSNLGILKPGKDDSDDDFFN